MPGLPEKRTHDYGATALRDIAEELAAPEEYAAPTGHDMSAHFCAAADCVTAAIDRCTLSAVAVTIGK